jgi:hypothetical protein
VGAIVAGRLLDFRLFVHDVELVRAGGEHVPFRLTDDGAWQRNTELRAFALADGRELWKVGK